MMMSAPGNKNKKDSKTYGLSQIQYINKESEEIFICNTITTKVTF